MAVILKIQYVINNVACVEHLMIFTHFKAWTVSWTKQAVWGCQFERWEIVSAFLTLHTSHTFLTYQTIN